VYLLQEDDAQNSIDEVLSQNNISFTDTKKGKKFEDYAVKIAAPFKLKAGDWISYDHQIFHGRNIKGVYVFKIDFSDKRSPLVVSNGDRLSLTDIVRVHSPEHEVGGWKEFLACRAVENYDLIEGQCGEVSLCF
jgi:hypothetical protein